MVSGWLLGSGLVWEWVLELVWGLASVMMKA
jgi:hypothetical protein